jgi:hypothetical protein
MCNHTNIGAVIMLNLMPERFYLITDAWGNTKAYKVINKIKHSDVVHSYFCLVPDDSNYNGACYIWDHGYVDTPRGPKKTFYASYEIYSGHEVSQSVAELYWGKPLK